MPAATQPSPRVLRVPVVAEMLACSKKTVYRMLDDKTLPEVRFGRSRRVPTEAVEALIRGRDPRDEA